MDNCEWTANCPSSMFITHCPTVTLQLHNFDLFRTCRTKYSFCTVAWQLAIFQLTRCIARSLGDSWTSCCILYAECPPYFYFWFVWATGLESRLHASTPTSIIPTKFEVDMTIHCRVIAFLSADTSRDLVTLTFHLFTLNNCHTWRITSLTLPPSLKTLRLSILELWVITFPVGYH